MQQRKGAVPDSEPRALSAEPRSPTLIAPPDAVQEHRAATGDVPRECLVDEAIARHSGEWILMKVTGHVADHMPAKGLVLAHSRRRADISRALAKKPRRSAASHDGAYQPYYTFKAFRRVR